MTEANLIQVQNKKQKKRNFQRVKSSLILFREKKLFRRNKKRNSFGGMIGQNILQKGII